MGLKNIFIDGAISSDKIAKSIAAHQTKTNIGAHNIFLGQVRHDEINGKQVVSIVYECYKEMALEVAHNIRESAFEKFNLTCLHIYHSLGEVKAGEICLFVFASSKHRKQAFEGCQYLVEEIKNKLPVFGKEVLEGESHHWKVNL